MKKLFAILLMLTLLVGCGSAPKTETLPSETTEPTTAAPAETPSEGTSENPSEGTSQEPTETTPPPELPPMEIKGTPGFGMNDVLANNHYTVMEAAPNDSNMTTVVAVAGEEQTPVFENRHVQVAFWMEYLNFMGSYGSYASMMGMDTSKPLWNQEIDEGKTWEQYFLEFAMEGLERNHSLSQYAEANNIVLGEDELKAVEEITMEEGAFAEEYTSQGYTDADTYLQYYFGEGTDAKSYQEYYKMYMTAAKAYQTKQEEITTALTDADVMDYYAENKETFENQGKLQVNNVNVRHILIQPEGEQADWTDEDWTAAEAAAQEIYDGWLADPTEDNFAALATEKTMDPGSKETGGLYEEVAPGDMVTEFNDWCFDAERQVGDHGIVKTSYGYHIMYYVGQTETRAWFDTAKEQLVYQKLEEFITACQQEYPLSVDYTLIRLFDVATANASAPVG